MLDAAVYTAVNAAEECTRDPVLLKHLKGVGPLLIVRHLAREFKGIMHLVFGETFALQMCGSLPIRPRMPWRLYLRAQRHAIIALLGATGHVAIEEALA